MKFELSSAANAKREEFLCQKILIPSRLICVTHTQSLNRDVSSKNSWLLRKGGAGGVSRGNTRGITRSCFGSVAIGTVGARLQPRLNTASGALIAPIFVSQFTTCAY